MKFKATFSEANLTFASKLREIKQSFVAEFGETRQLFVAKLGELQAVTEYVGGELYDGEYVATPKVDEQTMPTKDKVLIDDVTIKSIPFFDVSNTSGGSTVYIGSEV
jgi:hypothetical protein